MKFVYLIFDNLHHPIECFSNEEDAHLRCLHLISKSSCFHYVVSFLLDSYDRYK